MNAPTKGSGLTWVGRAIRRVEDPALLAGARPLHRRSAGGACACVSCAARWPPAASNDRDARRRHRRHRGRPRGCEADHAGAAQVRLCPDRPAGPGHRAACASSASRSRRSSLRAKRRPKTSPTPSSVDDRRHPRRSSMRARRSRDGAPLVHAQAARNLVVEGKVETPGFAAAQGAAHRLIAIEMRSRRQNATPLEARAGHAAFDPASERVTLTCVDADAAPAAHGDCRSASACRRAICASSRRMSAAASGRRCRSSPNTSSWSGWRASCEARSPGPRIGART